MIGTGSEPKKSEGLSSWKVQWENQVHQIHGSQTSQQLDTVAPMKAKGLLEQLCSYILCRYGNVNLLMIII